MKQIVGIFLVMSAVIFAGCSAKRSLEKGNYDTAIKRAVGKLQKKPYHPKSLNVLEAAYTAAQNEDLAEIKRLKLQGNPANWDKVYNIYKGIIRRQTLAKSVEFKPPNIQFIDYSNELDHARNEATKYHYALAKKYFNNAEKNRLDARAAYYEFQKVKGYQGSGYKDTDQIMSQARSLGMTYVLYKYENSSGQPVPVGLTNTLNSLPVGNLNSFWVNYHNREKEGTEYDYLAMLKLDNIAVSPERIKEIERQETREVTKLQVQYDEDGNVVKDSLDRPIKIKVSELIFCNVVEVHMSKSAMVSGSLHIVDVTNENYIKSQPVAGEMIFQHAFAKAFGNLDALSQATLDLIKIGEAPFPPDGAIIEDAASVMGKNAYDVLADCSSAIK